MSQDRIRRPLLDRTGPVRSPSTLLGTEGRETTAHHAPGATADGVKHRAEDPGGQDGVASKDQSPQDVIARSVNLGYSVIDDYIKRGQRAAAGLRRGTYGTDALADDLQDIGARMVQYLADFTATWAEFMDRAGTRGVQTPPWPTNGALQETRPVSPERTASESAGPGSDDHISPTPPPGRSTGSTELRVRVDVHTRRRAQISLDLKPVPVGRGLVVHALRASASGGPRIEQVAFEPGAADTGTIRVHIPDDLPAGTYSGLVVDEESNHPVGILMVGIEAD